MEDCSTPADQPIVFSFNITQHFCSEHDGKQDKGNSTSHNMDMRSFTPTGKEENSPGLSPIYPINELGETRTETDDSVAYNMGVDMDSMNAERAQNEELMAAKQLLKERLYDSVAIFPIIEESFLNENLNIGALLTQIGLEKCSDCFNISMEQFLNIKACDLGRMGVQSAEHCERVLALVEELKIIFQ